VLALFLLLSFSWHLQALAGKKDNRSDAIILLPSLFINFARPNFVYSTRENVGSAGAYGIQRMDSLHNQSTLHPRSVEVSIHINVKALLVPHRHQKVIIISAK
jgi:hypothetical protein